MKIEHDVDEYFIEKEYDWYTEKIAFSRYEVIELYNYMIKKEIEKLELFEENLLCQGTI